MSTPSPQHRYGVLVPVKPPPVAKSRLAPLGDQVRTELAAAFALDTVAAVLKSTAVGCVLAVTDDHVLAAALGELGAMVIPDGVTDDLNGSLVLAAAELARRFPDLRPAVVCADLPALRPAELSRALAAAGENAMSFVADADGRGTTVVAAADLGSFRPRFGAGSARNHRADGAWEITLPDVPSLRRDVDTPDDLEAAQQLGVGPRTAFVSTIMLGPGSPRL
jgi:2-phospho-L-lactate guanylyltransferase